MGVEIILYRPPGLYRNLFKAVPVGAGAVFALQRTISRLHDGRGEDRF